MQKGLDPDDWKPMTSVGLDLGLSAEEADHLLVRADLLIQHMLARLGMRVRFVLKPSRRRVA
ncbi:MAG: hypothetical protein HYU37_11555 [Acidobacteria bacterium]|nr:hypothetical protein [Acidobacteriota bacterium]